MTITKDQRLQLLGLLTLARDHAKKMTEVERAIHRIIGKDDSSYLSYFSDAIFDERDIDEILKLEEITVEG